MHTIQIGGLFIQPLAERVSAWLEAGKLGEAEVDASLTSNARSIIDLESVSAEWIPLEDVESLVACVAEQTGGDAGLAEWADSIVESWSDEARIVSILDEALGLVDGPGYVVSQSCERLVQGTDWTYEGGRDRFSVRVAGLGAASVALKSLLGALLSRLAECPDPDFDDVRFEGVDGSELHVFGERGAPLESADSGESRLHRAALVG